MTKKAVGVGGDFQAGARDPQALSAWQAKSCLCPSIRFDLSGTYTTRELGQDTLACGF